MEDRVEPSGERRSDVPGQAEADWDAIAQRAGSGDREAWSHVWRELAPGIHTYLRLAGASDPEALTSDVFVSLIRRDAELHGGWAGLRSLAFTVAHARLQDHRRRAHVRRGTTGYTPETDPRTTPSAEASVLAASDESEVIALLDLLTHEERAVLTLRFVADLDIAQTAAIIGRSPTTVSRLQARALRNLRGYLTPDSAGDDLSKGTPS